MTEAVRISETSVNFYESTGQNIPESCHLHTHRHEYLKSHSSLLYTHSHNIGYYSRNTRLWISVQEPRGFAYFRWYPNCCQTHHESFNEAVSLWLASHTFYRNLLSYTTYPEVSRQLSPPEGRDILTERFTWDVRWTNRTGAGFVFQLLPAPHHTHPCTITLLIRGWHVGGFSPTPVLSFFNN
jgi:hypothetical protein